MVLFWLIGGFILFAALTNYQSGEFRPSLQEIFQRHNDFDANKTRNDILKYAWNEYGIQIIWVKSDQFEAKFAFQMPLFLTTNQNYCTKNRVPIKDLVNAMQAEQNNTAFFFAKLDIRAPSIYCDHFVLFASSEFGLNTLPLKPRQNCCDIANLSQQDIQFHLSKIASHRGLTLEWTLTQIVSTFYASQRCFASQHALQNLVQQLVNDSVAKYSHTLSVFSCAIHIRDQGTCSETLFVYCFLKKKFKNHSFLIRKKAKIFFLKKKHFGFATLFHKVENGFSSDQ